MIDADLLLADTKKQVVALIDDLRAVAAADSDAATHVATEYQRAHAAGRTAFGQPEWAEGLYAQVAVAWVLGCVFVRFCEDNELIDDPLLGGPGIRSQIALDHRAAHLQANPAHDDRHWLREVFGRLRALPATGDIFGPHNLVWPDGLTPSADGARKLREELTRVDPETGELRHDFTDPTWDTRFLGDLYQDLSEHAKKTYALLQTPVFVQEFILDRTLDPAIAAVGLADTTVIDPTCGSGHFLLGAFSRLFDHWVDAEPSTNRRELARRALDAIGGIDLNPFAASIARFRLLLAALRAGGDTVLADAPAYEIHVAVGDSLLHGDPPGRLPGMHTPGEEEALVANHGYESEDIDEVRQLIGREWSAVVGNPPYITVKDPALNAAYRARFSTCHRKYSLGVPFTERFFQLARVGASSDRAGFVGLITADSFAQRDFGKPLIETFLPSVDLTHAISTAVVPLPGHGTSTMILFGRNRRPVQGTVRQVLGVSGGNPLDLVAPWRELLELIDQPGRTGRYLAVVDAERSVLKKHPWNLEGGGGAALKSRFDALPLKLGELVSSIGRTAHTGEDGVYFLDQRSLERHNLDQTIPVAQGKSIRDWVVTSDVGCVFPYDPSSGKPSEPTSVTSKHFWPYKAVLRRRLNFGQTNDQRGLRWFDQTMLFPGRLTARRWIAYAHVATHNHFALISEPMLFPRTAPALVLHPDHDASTHRLLALLNSSSVCFWMKQACYPKGGDPVGTEGARVRKTWWDVYYNFDSSRLAELPIPDLPSSDLSEACLRAAQLVEAVMSEVRTQTGDLIVGRQRAASAIHHLVALQEELDWDTYARYGLCEQSLTAPLESVPELRLGERAFEIALAREVSGGRVETAWFSRHGATPILEIPEAWPAVYRAVVESRLNAIAESADIALVERPECKRRWLRQPLEDEQQAGLRNWLLEQLEATDYWPDPAALTTTARLAAQARADVEFVRVASAYVGRDVDIAALVAELVSSAAVPYLAPYRYSDSGLRKYEQWLSTWELQRREDTGAEVGTIAAPPKYGKPDFNGVGWEHRGKLDVPKEWFISYPGAERETDASMVIGWAGWNHLDRARALAAWYLQARRDGRDAAHLTPLLAGLMELVPWLKQWYDEPNTDPALDRPGTQIAALVDAELRTLSLTAADLTAWRPAKKQAGRPRKATT